MRHIFQVVDVFGQRYCGAIAMKLASHLDNFPLIRTQSIDEVRESLAKIYAEPKIGLAPTTKTFNARINNCSLQHMSLAYGVFNVAMQMEFPAVDQFLQLIPIRGKAEISSGKSTATLTSGDSAFISPNSGYRASHSADRELLLLTIDARALTAKLTALIGMEVNKPLQMDLRQDCTRPVARTFREYLAHLVDTLSAANTPFPQWWIAQVEELVMAMLLFGHRHNYSHLLEERQSLDAAEWQVRRVEEYIEANWQEPITLECLAEVSGVSALDLCNTFQNIRGYSPVEFAFRVRSSRRRWQR